MSSSLRRAGEAQALLAHQEQAEEVAHLAQALLVAAFELEEQPLERAEVERDRAPLRRMVAREPPEEVAGRRVDVAARASERAKTVTIVQQSLRTLSGTDEPTTPEQWRKWIRDAAAARRSP